MSQAAHTIRVFCAGIIAAFSLIAAPAVHAQVQTIDPDTAIDWDIDNPDAAEAQRAAEAEPDGWYGSEPADGPDAPIPGATVYEPVYQTPSANPSPGVDWQVDGGAAPVYPEQATAGPVQTQAQTQAQAEGGGDEDGAIPENMGETYDRDTLLGAAEGVFGDGAEGLARLIEDVLRDQGEPNAYIVGREGGGAFIFGARYGSGTLYHKVEGERDVYWTGPSIGLDAGANVGRTFVLVYNLFDTEDLYQRFPAGEGQAYLVGGVQAGYVRRGDVVLIPISTGAGLRLGVNAGYMNFTKKRRWLPF
jgi:hypothetical protein